MSRTLKIFNIAVFGIWIALLSVLFYREYAGTPLEKTQALKGAVEKVTYWYDIYAGKTKIGFANTAFERVGEEIIIKHERELKVMHGDSEKLLLENLRCLSDSHYAIKSFEYSSHYRDEKGIKITGEVDADAVVFILESAGKRKTFRTPTRGRTIYLPTTFIPAIIQRNPSPRSAFTIPVLDMLNLAVSDVRVIVEETRPMKLGINLVTYYKIRVEDQVWWSNEKGIILKEEDPGGLTLYSQTETMAKDPTEKILFDPIPLPFLKSNRILQDAENLKVLRVRIKGFPLDPGIYEKSLVMLKNDTLIIQKGDPEEFKKTSYTLPCKDEGLSRYLAADEWVLSDDKTVKGNALKMSGVENNDAFRLARYLNSDLYFSIKRLPLFVLTNSRDIFKSKFGDYPQKTVMFASFARAAGLPTRLLGGFVYREGYFYFHTWPEVWLGKWVSMDPALAQFPADVTHIPLKEGTLKEITSMGESLKSFRIEILEAS
jgi:hypothetical protein